MARSDPLERPRTPLWLLAAVAVLALVGAIWVIRMVLGVVMWIIGVGIVVVVVWALVAAFGRRRRQ